MRKLIYRGIDGKPHRHDPKDTQWRPSVYGLIAKGKQRPKILLLLVETNGKLCFPGGGVELGETINMALDREVAEETGVILRPDKKVLTVQDSFFFLPFENKPVHSLLIFIAAQASIRKTEPRLDRYEKLYLGAPRWIPLDEALTYDSSAFIMDNSLKVLELFSRSLPI